MTGPLEDALLELKGLLADLPLRHPVPGAAAARVQRDELSDQLGDYVLPRLAQVEAPLLLVVGGSTGAGKSTLVNALVGERVSEPGVLRPTTRAPVLVHHPDDVAWFDSDRVLPDLARSTGPVADAGTIQLVSCLGVPRGLAVLDAPDIDSVERANRVLATQLLGAADLWIFVTSAARYADQVPWEFLRQAAERSAALAVVVDRLPPEAMDEVPVHLSSMMRERGLGEARLFPVAERDLVAGALPADAVADLRAWLDSLAADADARAGVVRQTLLGALTVAARRSRDLADAVEGQVAADAELRELCARAYDTARANVDDACADGTMLRGEVLARWQEFVGAGKVLRALESRAGWLRDRLTAAVTGRPLPADRVSSAVESRLEAMVLEHAEQAAETTADQWRARPAGVAVLEGAGEDGRRVARASRDLRPRVERLVRDWQGTVLDLVRSEGADRRTTARVLALGVNGLGVALMVVVFASTAGVTTAEVGVAGGTAVVGQKLLEAVFGDQAVRRLAAAARRDLADRVAALMAQESDRFEALLGTPPSAEVAGRLRDLAGDIERGAAAWDGSAR